MFAMTEYTVLVAADISCRRFRHRFGCVGAAILLIVMSVLYYGGGEILFPDPLMV